MHRSRVLNEVRSRPRIANEKFGRQQISLQSIAPCARQDHVAGHVRSAVRQRKDVVERRDLEFQTRGTIHTASAAVAHGGAFDRSLLRSGWNWFGPASSAREAGKGDMVELPTSGQCHLAKKGHPATGAYPVAGCRADPERAGRSGDQRARAAVVLAAPDMMLDVVRVGSSASGMRARARSARARGTNVTNTPFAQEPSATIYQFPHAASPPSGTRSYSSSPCAPSRARQRPARRGVQSGDDTSALR